MKVLLTVHSSQMSLMFKIFLRSKPRSMSKELHQGKLPKQELKIYEVDPCVLAVKVFKMLADVKQA